jgi:hypothetical protein
MPKPPRRTHGLAQRLQENFVAGEYHQLYDVAREAEPQRIHRAALVFGS